MSTVRTPIGGKTAARELSSKIGHECRQGLGGRRGTAPEDARAPEVPDLIDVEIERGGAYAIRRQRGAVQGLGRERSEEGERQMKVARMGRTRTDRHQGRESSRQRSAHRLVGP
jgi:hypothetical protein